MFVEGRRSEVLLATPNFTSPLNREGIPLAQIWELQSQRPGSGVLDVECLHKGPTLVIRITDRTNPELRVGGCGSESNLNYYSSAYSRTRSDQQSDSWNFETNISMRNGLCHPCFHACWLGFSVFFDPLRVSIFIARSEILGGADCRFLSLAGSLMAMASPSLNF
ncbi:hypothetical protein Tcan_02414 [Toxocara canis]|uniref:Uncharacterized protein n=1 Tax=Toxocara canis TaxID=6265 RepID=A0A0B2UPY7_TOXCA|nr:hypothetical protein Tcan_02414 [Toxocara canis]